MKTKNVVAKYVGLFALVFSLSFVGVLSMYGNSVACGAGPCLEWSESLPSECDNECVGQTGNIVWSGSISSSVCCGVIVDCLCH
jgi:hypothetical protein